MTQLTAVATLLTSDIDTHLSHVDLTARLPDGSVTLETFTPLADRVTPTQLVQIYAGVSELRRAFSSHLLTHLTVRRVNAATLARADVASDAARQRLEEGGVLVSIPAVVDFEGRGAAGRPEATPIDDAFKHALAQAVARIVRLAAVADNDQYAIFERQYPALGESLETRAALFNLNAEHQTYSEFPVLNWCETRGPRLLAAAYGLEENELEAALEAALKARIRHGRFETVLGDELARIETLLAWFDAHVERKRGEAGRRDSTRRVLKKHGLDWQTAPGAIDPPRMHTSVRRNLVAQNAMARLDPRAMVEAAILFDLEPAYSVFLTRLYLLPVLAAAGLAGRVGLRRQQGQIAGPIAAGGLLALAERRADGVKDVSGLLGEGQEDEIGAHQALVEAMFERCGLATGGLAERAQEFLRTGLPVAIDPPQGPRRFFFDD